MSKREQEIMEILECLVGGGVADCDPKTVQRYVVARRIVCTSARKIECCWNGKVI